MMANTSDLELSVDETLALNVLRLVYYVTMLAINKKLKVPTDPLKLIFLITIS